MTITGDTVTWAGKNQLQYTAFTIGCAQMLAQVGALDAQHLDATSPIVGAAIDDFNDEHPLNGFGSAGEALEMFHEWLPTWASLPRYVKRIENGSVTICLTMPSKSGATISIELSEQMLEAHTQYLVNKTVLKLSDMARNAYLSLLDVRGAFGVQPSQADEPQNAVAPGQTKFPVIGILVTEENNKRYYKVLIGEWTAFGVRVWEEVLESSGVDFANLPIGKNPVRGYGTVKYNKDGQPSKVTSLEIIG